jgi:hypothetical protein
VNADTPVTDGLSHKELLAAEIAKRRRRSHRVCAPARDG